jgi:hypothetical protein
MAPHDNSVEYFTFDLLEEGIIILHEYHFQYANKSAKQFFNLTVNALGHDCSLVFDKWKDELEHRSLGDCIKDRDPIERTVCNGNTHLSVRVFGYSSTMICCIFTLSSYQMGEGKFVVTFIHWCKQ